MGHPFICYRARVFRGGLLKASRLHFMQLYAITDRHLHRAPAEGGAREHLLHRVESWAAGGVQFIQLREKDLDSVQLESLARDVKNIIGPRQTRLILNLSSPELTSVALASGADGVHLPGKPVAASIAAVRAAFRSAGRQAILSVPCHSLEDVALAREAGVDLILFSPVFEKLSAAPQGLATLRQACLTARGSPVFALGGVTAANAAGCLAAGATGAAGIRLFAEGDWLRLARQTQPIEPYIVE
jgi:thiamine-phosphate pyrophosphorylase